ANLNDSEDSLDMAELVEHIVLRHAPNYASLFADGDPALETLAIGSATEHLRGRPAGARWGWKLCETGHALPVIARLFPDAQVIHLIRDGRDVAFSPFVAPKHAYWRKIYFGAGDLRSWRGLPMTQRAYRKHGPMFNAARWANSVTLGRAHGAMLGERYCEVRYEDLVADPVAAGARIAAFLGLPPPELPVGQLAVNPGRVGKWRSLPDSETVEVLQLLAPTLAAFGYDKTGAPP
ncbi:MAG TPA: sulfotransferase, partial [Caulobacteraceae bacterium]|nr:sulfotransferase [Caulobacteraceae bacterium]